MSKKNKNRDQRRHLSHYYPMEAVSAIENTMDQEAARINYCDHDMKKHLKSYAEGLKLVLSLIIDTKAEQLAEYYKRKEKIKELDCPPFDSL